MSSQTNVSSELLNTAKYFSEFAFNVYTAARLSEDDLAGVADIMTVSQEDVIMVELQDDEGEGICPKFVFFIDHKSKSLVLAVRGN